MSGMNSVESIRREQEFTAIENSVSRNYCEIIAGAEEID
jgi:hypothetical protein